MNNPNFLIDRDHSLINKLKEIIKHLHVLLMSGKVKGEVRFEIENIIQLLESTLKSECAELKPTTLRLKDAINQAILENEHGDGVMVMVLKNKNAKIEKCSLLKMYLDGK